MNLEPKKQFSQGGKTRRHTATAEWSVDQLGQYAQSQEVLCAGLGRKMAVHRFREGHALTLAFEKIGYGGWTPFLKKYNISHSSADRARKLYARAMTEEKLVGLTVMDAYEEFEIDRPQADRKEQWPEGKSSAKTVGSQKISEAG